MIYLSILILTFSGVCKALMDLSSEGNLPWKNIYFHKTKSWTNKWKTNTGNDNTPKKPIKAIKGDNWWYLGILKPNYKENFPFSSTILVFTTDFWHLIQWCYLKLVVIGIVMYDIQYPTYTIIRIPVIDIIILSTIMLVPFQLTYSYFKKK